MPKKAARERWASLPEDRPAELIGEEIVPRSPGTAGHSNAICVLAKDRTLEVGTYAAAGVSHVWLVDPAARQLEALEVEGDR